MFELKKPDPENEIELNCIFFITVLHLGGKRDSLSVKPVLNRVGVRVGIKLRWQVSP
jgi:hypothetical protein